MNNKAAKSNLWSSEKPPLFNLSDNRPWVDPTFRYFEHNNAPFINEMLMPLNVKNTNSKATYDHNGSRYEIKNGYLQKDGVNLFATNTRRFKRTNITSEMSGYTDYDLSDGNEAYTIYNSTTHTFKMHYKATDYETTPLFVSGVVIATRIRILNYYTVFTVCYMDGATRKIKIYILDGTTSQPLQEISKSLTFYKYTPRRNSSEAWNSLGRFTLVAPENINPIINIADVNNQYIGVSVVNSYGEVLNTRYNGFATYLINNLSFATYQVGADIYPDSQTTTETVTTNYTIDFVKSYRAPYVQSTHSAISSDASVFYDYDEGTKGNVINFPTNYSPTSQGTKVNIDGVEYTRYSYQIRTYSIQLVFTASPNNADIRWSATAFNKDTNTNETTAYDTDSTKYLTITKVIYPNTTINLDQDTYWGDTYTYEADNNDPLVTSHSVATQDINASLDWSITTTVTGSSSTYPTVVCDNGKMYDMCGFTQATNSWNNLTIANGQKLIESGTLTAVTTGIPNTYTITALESVTITNSANIIRNNSFVLNQNIVQQTMRLCNNKCRVPAGSTSNSVTTYTDNDTASRYKEFTNSSAYDLRFSPGTSSYTSFNYYGDYATESQTNGGTEDYMIFQVAGMRTPVKNGSHFNILFNTVLAGSCLPYGISWSSDEDHLGTLLTPLTSIDDDVYIIADGDVCIYRDKNNQWFKLEVVDGNEITALLDNRYILVNTTSYINMYDSVTGNKLHYASDYNDRLMFGISTNNDYETSGIWAGYKDSTVMRYVRVTANGINAAYQIQPRIAVVSTLYPIVSRVRVNVAYPHAYGCEVDEATQGIDVYYSKITDSTAKYQFTIETLATEVKYMKYDLVGSTYTITALSYIAPCLFTKYINGAGNNDMAVETYDNYVLVYYNQQPYFLYTLGTQVTNVASGVANNETSNPYESQAFFVIQGQFYAVISEKIYSVTYSSGSISSMEAIVDIRGMKFIGNNPQIAFFWSPSMKCIYSWTGDAILEPIYNASKISYISGANYYDESSQSIYIPTDVGLLVLGPKNIYMLEEYKDVSNIQFSADGVTHITNGDETINMTFYPTDGYEALPIKIATSFYGLGDTESTSIDRWNITVFDQTKKNETSYVKVRVRSITDTVVTSEERTFSVKPEMFDKWSNSVLLAYNPKLIKGQGIRLEVETPLTIQSITPHVMDNRAGTVTKHGV